MARPERILGPCGPRPPGPRRSRDAFQPGATGLSNRLLLCREFESALKCQLKKGPEKQVPCLIGAPGEIRTPDRLVRSQVLYPAELRARMEQQGRALCEAGARPVKENGGYGGERGIRTLDTGLSPYTPLAGERLRPARPSLHGLALRGRKHTWVTEGNKEKRQPSATLRCSSPERPASFSFLMRS
jgi:hypothetical protein